MNSWDFFALLDLVFTLLAASDLASLGQTLLQFVLNGCERFQMDNINILQAAYTAGS